MTNIFTSKTNFTSGELSTDLLGRVDLNAYNNGAFSLKNVFVEPTGGIHRRPGLRYIASLTSSGRLIPYDLSSTDQYLLILMNQRLDIYHDNTFVTTITMPWTLEQVNTVQWAALQNQGVIFVHPDTQPILIHKSGNTWTKDNFSFLTEDSCILQPYHRFCDDSVTISSSGCLNNVTLTASEALFTNSHVNKQFKLAEGYVLITAVTDSTHAQATVLKKLINDDNVGENTVLEATRAWGEPAFCSEYGWPATVCTYQSRLVFGGSKSLPNTLWFSQSGDIKNFETGAGYDAEAIEFDILSDQSNKICALFAGRHLQIFTTSAEWMVSGDPLTPSEIQLKRQTQVGSCDTRFVPPIGIDGATIFAAENGHEIREFLFSDLEGMYQATDLSLLSSHLIQNPIDMAYDKNERQAYIVMNTGKMATLTSFRSENLQSWTEQTTDGKFLAVGILGKTAYFIVKRDSVYHLEYLDENCHTDSAYLITKETATTTVNNLSVLNNKKVAIVADDIILDKQTVQSNTIQVAHPAKQFEIGLPFSHIVVPLPPVASSVSGSGGAPVANSRLVRAVFRVIDTKSLEIDTGSGAHQELVPNLSSYTLNSANSAKTQDVVVRCLGWSRTPTSPLWEIKGDTPLPFKLVSVTSDIKLGG
ncbi:MAG: hypothetical protein J6Y85_03640 [Alphaproteobacteria bacterium]|nr:hypothetical protein [Alphaproteobacteria bacterium]